MHEATKPAMSRYADAYIVARTIDGLGTAIKYAGIGIGSLIVFVSAAGTTTAPLVMPSSLGAARFFVALIAAAAGIGMAGVVGTLLFLLGTLMAAQAQVLKATLDTAVNTSRVLSDEDCARIMALPVGRQTGVSMRIPIGAALNTSGL